MKKVRWGVLGTAKVGREKVIPAMQQCAYGEVAALASRDTAKARALAGQLGIPTVHDSYDALLADPQRWMPANTSCAKSPSA
jgi:predicted dehydrogenase